MPVQTIRALLAVLALCCFAPALARAEAEPARANEDQRTQRLVYIAVVGAPGDGEKALSEALGRQLAAVGIGVGDPQASDVYMLEGTVKLAAAKGGKQGVRIDWVVYAPDGRTLGGVSQVKLVRKGSLDKNWGRAADTAAAAAAPEIVKLLGP